MELLDIIQQLRDFYAKSLGQPPREITVGRFWYEKAREQGIVEAPPSWSNRRGRILDMEIDIDPRDDYKIAIEDYHRYQDGVQHRFELRD
jgi:hypothetical protein